jgi:hypothetical protein
MKVDFPGAILSLLFVRAPLGPLLALSLLVKGSNIRYVGFKKEFKLSSSDGGSLKSEQPLLASEDALPASHLPIAFVSHNLW